MIGLVSSNDETAYRLEVEQLEAWRRANNLCKKTIVGFRIVTRSLPAPLLQYIGGTAVEVVKSFKYLGIHVDNDLTWHTNSVSLTKAAHQRLYFLRRLKWAGLGTTVLASFYR